MARQVIWGILPDDREQPRIEFGEDTTTKEAFLSINGMDVNPGGSGNSHLQPGTGAASVQQLPDGVADGFDFTGKNPNATKADPTLTGTIPYGATGDFASAFGGKCRAEGKRSHAEGTTTIAKGDYSHSEGNATVALGANAHAEGAITTAFGSTSHAEGQKTQAKGENSHAEGMSTITEGRGSHSEGFGTKAIGNYSHAEGYGSQALHDESHASGYYTKTGMPMQTVCGAYNIGRDNTFFEIGNGNATKSENIFEVYTDGLIAVGNKVQQIPRADKVTQKEGETAPHFDFTGHADAGIAGRIQYGAIGNYSVSLNGRSSAQNKHATAIGNSTIAKGEESFAQGYETIAEGNGSAAFGSRTWAKGKESHTEGILTLAEGQAAHAEGSLTKAIGTHSHAEGYMTEANGDYTHSEGSATKTYGFSSHAEGNEAIADTNASHAEGSGTKVISYQLAGESGESGPTGGIPEETPDYNDYESTEDFRVRYAACAHAEGNNSVAMGYSAHAEGVGTNAYGRASHTEGWCTQTGELIERVEDGKTYNVSNLEKGMAAHAEGYNTKAIANYSHASGFETIADKEAQTVVGKYNNKQSRNGSLFVVGAGGNDGSRKNALEVISDGEIVIYWEGNYYSLNNMLNLIANKYGGTSFFDLAKK